MTEERKITLEDLEREMAALNCVKDARDPVLGVPKRHEPGEDDRAKMGVEPKPEACPITAAHPVKHAAVEEVDALREERDQLRSLVDWYRVQIEAALGECDRLWELTEKLRPEFASSGGVIEVIHEKRDQLRSLVDGYRVRIEAALGEYDRLRELTEKLRLELASSGGVIEVLHEELAAANARIAELERAPAEAAETQAQHPPRTRSARKWVVAGVAAVALAVLALVGGRLYWPSGQQDEEFARAEILIQQLERKLEQGRR